MSKNKPTDKSSAGQQQNAPISTAAPGHQKETHASSKHVVAHVADYDGKTIHPPDSTPPSKGRAVTLHGVHY